MRAIIALTAVLFLMGQEGSCATTSTTRAERCQGYKTALLAAQRISDDSERLERIGFYRELISAWCPPS